MNTKSFNMLKYLFVISLLVGGCQAKIPFVTGGISAGEFNENITKAVFLYNARVSKKATGISAFPDGGIPKILLQKSALYIYDISGNNLQKIFTYKSDINRFYARVSFVNKKIAFSITPRLGWNYEIKHGKNKDAVDNYRGIFIYDLLKNKTTRLTQKGIEPFLSPDGKYLLYFVQDADYTSAWTIRLGDNDNKLLKRFKRFNYCFAKAKYLDKSNMLILKSPEICIKLNIETGQAEEVALKKAKEQFEKRASDKVAELVKNLPFKKFGIDINKYCQKSKRQRRKDIIELKGNNFGYRKAVLEELNNDMSKKDLQILLKEMDNYKEQLNSSEKLKYELPSKKTIGFINTLIQKK
ncbi:MAG: hypothetical protein JRC89_07600 [Deltaproteobacteria bacterium]|nr:hypothetical protein [Deltaproteobacteria bacterium]